MMLDLTGAPPQLTAWTWSPPGSRCARGGCTVSGSTRARCLYGCLDNPHAASREHAPEAAVNLVSRSWPGGSTSS